MNTDTLGRRLRFAEPSPQGYIVIGPTDLAVFEAIHRHGVLPSRLLFELTDTRNWTAFQKRLTKLYNGDEGGPYLARPPQQFAGFEARYQHLVYDLTPRSRALLASTGHPAKRKDPFLHQLMQACVGASLELTAGSRGMTYVPRAQILREKPLSLPLHGFGERATLMPDDLFGLRNDDGKTAYFAIEIDRNTEPTETKDVDTRSSFGRKVAAYLQVMKERTYREEWNVPYLTVLTVTTNATHARNLIDYIRRQGQPKYAGRFLFMTVDEFGPNWRVPKVVYTHLLGMDWQSVSGPADLLAP